jgi:hypothetical protein
MGTAGADVTSNCQHSSMKRHQELAALPKAFLALQVSLFILVPCSKFDIISLTISTASFDLINKI